MESIVQITAYVMSTTTRSYFIKHMENNAPYIMSMIYDRILGRMKLLMGMFLWC